METTKHPLTTEQRQFFASLAPYLNLPFYFFGSIQRSDYVAGQSDIDVDLFSPEPEKIARRLHHLLQGSDEVSIKRVWWQFDGHEITGYKVKYKRPVLQGVTTEPLKVEFSIYGQQVQPLVLQKHRQHMFVSPYISFLLLLLKTFFRKSWIYPAVKKQVMSHNDIFVSFPYPV